MTKDIGYLIGTGFALGVVHVLTGPDHLSALATLSANVGNTLEAALLGIRWGVGHSSGLLVVGTILIILTDSGQETVDMPDYATHVFESIVGIFMLLLGAYGVRRAWLKRPKGFYNTSDSNGSPTKDKPESHHHYHPRSDGIFTIDSGEFDPVPPHSPGADNHEHDNNQQPESSSNQNLEIYFEGDENPVCLNRSSAQDHLAPVVTVSSDELDMEEAVVVEQAYMQTVSPSRCRRCINNMTRRISVKTMAFLAGIVHGLAGPGGVLGVIPAVQLRSWKLAALYLSCFCISSTCTMGCFAIMYGTCSSKLTGNGTDTRREFQIECFSACLSILVGIIWLTLLSVGKLEDVFP